VAILLVVLFHVGIPQVSGGFVGVDVFFVISGFVITGLLLRERSSSSTNFLSFYARRARRILPAALLVIVVSLVASALLVNADYATLVASDARWTSVFLGNFHFAQVYPNYLVNRPQSPLQQFWSLAVEEQFYLVYPAFFVGVIAIARWRSERARLVVALTVVIVLSLGLSIVSTHLGQLATYDSPFTRAWELALGALVAVCTRQLERIPPVAGALLTWVGVAGILLAANIYSTATRYPGVAVVLPVVSTALVIAGGTPHPRWAAESVLRTTPFRWGGRWSYSWYLWHWPLLVLAAQVAHTNVNTQSIATNVLIVAVALAMAATTYFLVENPIRHSERLKRSPRASLVGAGALVITCVAFTFAF
jgi:peptidoglycan/LPS O-acetylase OafA/YrhL